MVETAINTGLRWGELIALKPRHLDLITAHADASRRPSSRSRSRTPPPAHGCSPSPTPRTTNPAPWASRPTSSPSSPTRSPPGASGPDDLLFATRDGTPISRNTFRTRVWLPAVKASGVDFPVRMHDLRHAHASWLLAEGSDLKSVMERMGHAQIQDHPEVPARATRSRPQKPRRPRPSPPTPPTPPTPSMNPSTPQGVSSQREAHPCTHPDDEALIQQIQPVLELDHQYTRHVEAWNDDLVAQIRRCGRAAGRRLGYKVRSSTSVPRDRDDRRVVVWLVVTASNPDDEDRIHQRGELLVQGRPSTSSSAKPIPRPPKIRLSATRQPLRAASRETSNRQARQPGRRATSAPPTPATCHPCRPSDLKDADGNGGRGLVSELRHSAHL